jgi:hypothetical protein
MVQAAAKAQAVVAATKNRRGGFLLMNWYLPPRRLPVVRWEKLRPSTHIMSPLMNLTRCSLSDHFVHIILICTLYQSIHINNMSHAFFADVDVSGFPDDALTDHQKYEHPLVSRYVLIRKILLIFVCCCYGLRGNV